MGGNLPITRAVIYLHEEDEEPHSAFEPEPIIEQTNEIAGELKRAGDVPRRNWKEQAERNTIQ